MPTSQSIISSLDSATSLGLVFAGILFLVGLLTGIWKFQQMMVSRNGLAHRYVDIAHRAALTYSFACILLAVFSLVSQLDETIEFYAMLVLVVSLIIAEVGGFTVLFYGLLNALF